MARRPSRSFANRLMLGYIGTAVGLMFLIGAASTVFTFRLYARTSNEIIASATRTIERRVTAVRSRHLSLAEMAPRITADIGRPRIRIVVYDQDRRVLSESSPPRPLTGAVGAAASLMELQTAKVPVQGGLRVEPAGEQDLVDQLIELGHVAPQRVAHLGFGLLAQHCRRHGDAGERRAQLVAAVGQQQAVRGHQLLDTVGGAVEAFGEGGELVAALDLDARAEVAAG